MIDGPGSISSNPAKRTRPVIAIDGPAGAGKSTMAAHLARRFGFLNLETGAMYRAFALKAIENDIDVDSEPELMRLSQTTHIRLEPMSEGNRVLLDSVNVSHRVRETDVTAAASRVSVHPQVRSWMVDQQRALGAAGGIVMEGRDIGTVVFPDAEVKIFLDAAPEVRGNRRYRQGGPVLDRETQNREIQDRETQDREAQDRKTQDRETQDDVLRELKERDARDRNRAESPLHPAGDAIVLDSTDMTLEQVLQTAERVVTERTGAAAHH